MFHKKKMKGISNKTKVKFSKIRKKQTKRKDKKSLKLVKRIQKGGVGNEEVFGIISKKTRIDFEREYPACLSLIGEFSQSPEQLQPRVKMNGTSLKQFDFWSYESKIKPTPNFESIFEDPLGWYQHKNPDFLIHRKPNLEEIVDLPFDHENGKLYINPENQVKVPEYKFLIAQMIKDLLLALYLGSMPQLHKNNKHNLKSNEFTYNLNKLSLNNTSPKSILFKKNIILTLDKIEENIKNEYIYTDFFDYLYLFSDKECDLGDNGLWIPISKKIILTPFIILPTLIQIDFKKSIDLAKAPLLNFRLNNNRKKIHDLFDVPCSEIVHDIIIHCHFTHRIRYFLTKIYLRDDPDIDVNILINQLSTIYRDINIILIKLKELYNYTDKSTIEYIYCIFLFCLLHETDFGVYTLLKNNDVLFIELAKEKKNILFILKSLKLNIKDVNFDKIYDEFIEQLKLRLIPVKKGTVKTRLKSWMKSIF